MSNRSAASYETQGVQIVFNWILLPRPFRRLTKIESDFRMFYRRADSVH